MLRVLLVAAARGGRAKSNWAPGYRTAGNATTIDDGEAEETWAAYDHAYKAPNGWELQPFAYQNPEQIYGVVLPKTEQVQVVLAGVGLRAHEEISTVELWRCLHGQQVEIEEHVQPVVPELPGGHGVHADLGTGWP